MERLRSHALQVLSVIHANLAPRNSESRDTSLLFDQLLELPPPLLAVLRRQTALLFKPVGSYNGVLLLKRLADLEKTGRGKLYVYPFHEVPVAWRRLVCEVGVVRAVAEILGISDGESEKVDWIDEVVKTLDMVLIMSGAPGEGRREWIEKTFEILEDVIERKEAPESNSLEPPAKRMRIDNVVPRLASDSHDGSARCIHLGGAHIESS
ncbi:hypothetical protein V491_03299 [Pseudogymnoascus sp. VKM F-3775]|nr:hypothetical protein V491_03299 [Pseudogymnoascus sp. VKM F-3775]